MKFRQDAIRDGSFLLNVEARDISSVLQHTLDFVVARGLLPDDRRSEVESALLARERQVSTAIGNFLFVLLGPTEAMVEHLDTLESLDAEETPHEEDTHWSA